GNALRYDDGGPIDRDLKKVRAHAAIWRSGANGAGSTGERSLSARDAMISAVAVAVVIPSPSCPAATINPGTARHHPISGSLSDVVGRNPVHTRMTESPASAGMNRTARSSMRPSTIRLIDPSHPTSSREDPTRT